MQQVSQQEPLQPLLTIQGVARVLGVSRPTVYALMEREGLPYLKLGKSLRFSPPSVSTWLAEHEQTREE
jgi:excisionase family DNA binding protein